MSKRRGDIDCVSTYRVATHRVSNRHTANVWRG